MFRYLALAAIAGLAGLAAEASPIRSFCDDGDTARVTLQSGSLQTRPYFQPGIGMRVQEQHPDTKIWAQAKYIDWLEGKEAVLCQYYNSVGLVATYMTMGAEVSIDADRLEDCPSEACEGYSYWRREWVESAAEADVAGQEMLYTCVEQVDGVTHPSTGCSFVDPEMQQYMTPDMIQ